jgi:TolB-like protein
VRGEDSALVGPTEQPKWRASRRWRSFCHAGTSRVKLQHDTTIAASTPPLSQTSMADVFVSYARSDKARVAPLVAAIEAQGWSVWWDPQIDPGQEFDRQIAAELKAAAVVLVVWTPASVTSRWVRGEAREGADRGILVPVRFEAASLPIDVRALHTTDLDEWGDDPRSPQARDVLRAVDAIIKCDRARKPAGARSDRVASEGATEPTRVAICVLPFANMSGDPQQDYFSDGITEDIITELSRWRLLAVRSRSAAFQYRGVAVNMKHVARELNVRFIVEGSVRRMDARIRINAQLIDSESGSHIWAEKFDRDLAELFTVQDQVVQTIVSTLVGRVHASDFERVRRKPPANLAAYECVLKGNALPWDDPDGAAEAARLFEKAIEIDPGYGPPYALLASIFQGKWRDDPSSSDSLLLKAFALAKRAVELDQNDSTCLALLGWIELVRRSYDLALQHVRRAVAMNPNNQWNAADMGGILLYVGEAEEALAWFKRAKEIDPYFNEPWYWRSLGEAHMVLQQYQEALAAFDHSPSRIYRVAAFMAGCYARLADMEHARVHAAECLAMKPDFSTGHFVAKQPFKNPADAASLTESLRMAGLPQ